MGKELEVKFASQAHALNYAWLFDRMQWQLKRYEPVGLEQLAEQYDIWVWRFNIYQPGNYYNDA